jgi:phosphomannomutase
MLEINPFEKEWQEIELSKGIVDLYRLETWAKNFSLMTAGYRSRLNPNDANDPAEDFNSLIVAILGEAKARVFRRKLAHGEQAHVLIGGETRPHTQDFIAVLSRVYAAHDIRVHLRAHIRTTPIWYSSFGIFYKGYQSGDNLTASHSPFFKGGWKPMDSSGKQLLAEEEEIISEVKNIVNNREKIRLAPWELKDKIFYDFDVDEAYVNYQKSVLVGKSRDDIKKAVEKGYRCAVCTVGGSMKSTTERLFPMFGIPTGENGAIHYLFGEEDSQYHKLGQKDGKNFGPDPSKPEVYKSIGAQEILLKGQADIVFIWDPDGDRFNIITTTNAKQAEQAKAFGVEVESYQGDRAIVYFNPNQLFFMLTAYRIDVLKAAGLLNAYDWFIAPSISASRSIAELVSKENIPIALIRVGFKYMGTFSEWLENRSSTNEPFINAIGDEFYIGNKPRALIMCEESGGAIFGGTELIRNETGEKGLIALREKDGMQFGLVTLALSTHLYNNKQSLSDYYCNLVEKHDIRHRFFNRRDVMLYKEDLMDPEDLKKAKSDGERKRNLTMDFFKKLAEQAAAGKPLDEIRDIINAKLVEGYKPIPRIQRICNVGEGKQLEGTLMEFDEFWFLIRASGTDALLRYYIEGKDKDVTKAYQQSLINLKI